MSSNSESLITFPFIKIGKNRRVNFIQTCQSKKVEEKKFSFKKQAHIVIIIFWGVIFSISYVGNFFRLFCLMAVEKVLEVFYMEI
jgi:hypothetical protein